MTWRARFALLALLLAFSLTLALPVGAQVAYQCPNGGPTLTNTMSLVVNVRPGTYTATALGVGEVDPIIAAIYPNGSVECNDDSLNANGYLVDLPSTGAVNGTGLSSQLEFTNRTGGFADVTIAVGDLGNRSGGFVLLIEGLRVTTDDGTGNDAGDPISARMTPNMVSSGVPIAMYMMATEQALDPVLNLVDDSGGPAVIDGELVQCDDAGGTNCWGVNESLVGSRINTVPGGPRDAMMLISLDGLDLGDDNEGFFNFKFTSFNQQTFGPYIVAYSGAVLAPGDAPATGGSASAGGAGGSTAASGVTCTTTGQDLVGDPGTTLQLTCPAGCTTGSLWGTDVYTDDSTLCYAAQHAGVITADGGPVSVSILPGQDAYPSTTQNGITSSEWASWGRSFGFGAASSSGAASGGASSGGNPDAASATPIELNDTIQGELAAGTVDLYRFEGTAGQTVLIEMTSAGNSFDTFLQLVAPDGAVVTDDDDSAGDLQARIENFELASIGTYVIRAQAFGGVDGSGSGAYTLKISGK